MHIHIYIYGDKNIILVLVPRFDCYYIYIYNIATSFLSLFYVVFESTLLNYANSCRNWTFKRFTRVAENKERNGTNEKSDTR